MRIVLTLMLAAVLALVPSAATPVVEPEPEPIIIEPVSIVILCPDIVYRYCESQEEAIAFNNKITHYLHLMAQQEPHPTMTVEAERLRNIQERLRDDIRRFEEYPVATYIWQRLRNDGFSEAVAAGIIGNMAIECGGFTLHLQPDAYNSYEHGGGLCGWLYCYYPDAQGATLEEQYNLLMRTLKWSYTMFGASYERFLAMTDPAEAAYAFAKNYERCYESEYNYRVRRDLAKVAFGYYAVGQD